MSTYTKKYADGSYKSFNFVAPDGAANQLNEVMFPFHDKQEPAYGATLAVTIKQKETFLQPATLTGAMTINLTIDPQVTAGAKLHVKLTADGTQRVTTMGTGFNAATPTVTAAISTTVFKTYVYDGTSFLPVS